MGATQKYVVIDPATGKIDRRIFSDQAVYDDEMERIFGRAWLMIGHESLVPAADDFFHTYMGEDPVILTRDGQGRLHALLNMCRHRGNRVVRCDDGNATRFMCTYHGWTYQNDGTLDHVPGEAEAYYDALDRDSLGLVEARVETYAGIVFATWAEDAPSLEAYLGDARWYLDTVFNRRDGGMQALGPMKWLEPVNWKTHGGQLLGQLPRADHSPLQRPRADQASSAARGCRTRTSSRARTSTPSSTATRSPSATRTTTCRATCTASRPRPPRCSRSTTTPPCPRSSGGSARCARAGCSSATTPSSRTGSSASAWRCLAARSRPSSGTSCCWTREAPEALKRAIRVGSQANNGAAGMFEQDDVDNWRQVTAASTSRLGRRYPQDLSMGLGHAGPHPDYPGLVSERYISENNQRLFYQRWEEFMNAESWADIPLDPIKARFEGTATLRG